MTWHERQVWLQSCAGNRWYPCRRLDDPDLEVPEDEDDEEFR